MFDSLGWVIPGWPSSWGSSPGSESVSDAAELARTYIARVAAARSWLPYWEETAEVFISQAAARASDSTGFWSSLAALWAAHEASLRRSGNAAALPAGWSELGATWASGQSMADQTAQGREAGTVQALVEEVRADIAQKADPSRSLVPWVVLAAAGLGLYLLGRSGR